MLTTSFLTSLPIPFFPGCRSSARSRPGASRRASTAYRFLCFAIPALLWLALPPQTPAQQAPKPDSPTKVTSVLGFEDLKKKEKCQLEISATAIRLKGAKSTVELAPSSIEDVLTGDDSARLVGGFLGTLTMFAPYSSGRFLSLFRTKLDTITIQYRDADGGLHGGILAMKAGQAAGLKKRMVDVGARTTVPIEEAPKPASALPGDPNSRKNSERKS
jgi:hypothetical protein